MKQLIQDFKTGQLRVVEVPPPALQPGCVLVRNVCSLISAGTERATVETARKSLLGKARARPDLVQKVLDSVRREGLGAAVKKVRTRLDSWKQLGYASAGTVLEVGERVPDLQPADPLACAGQDVASHAEVVCVPRHLCAKIPAGVEFEEAAFATLGAIALQGVRQAEVEFGEIVAVIGLGLIGQLTVQILRAAGAHVLGVDLNPAAVALARQNGAEAVAVRGTDDPVAIVRSLSGGHGADAVLITASTSSNEPVELAAALCRDRGRVVMVGVTGMTLPRGPYYEKELSFRFSRSYGPGRYDPRYEQQGLDYPFGHVRWTLNRNLVAFLDLVAQKQIRLQPLITHRFPIERAVEAYDLITGRTHERPLAVLLRYDSAVRASPSPPTVSPPPSGRPGALSIGVIGAGNYAQASLLPPLQKMPHIEFRIVCTRSGASAKKAAEKFGFATATTQPRQVWEEKAVGAVIIATRHSSHAELTAAALQAGKFVFVEKPLALDEAGLALVARAVREHGEKLQVGFNRRFAPLTQEAIRHRGSGPWVIHYRVNAGPIPTTHWIQDPAVGGGRILGEVCHFVDFLQHLVGARAVRVFAETLGGGATPAGATDNVQATLRFADGSVGVITYSSGGDPGFPKERCEMFGGGRVLVLDDFRSLTISAEGRTLHRRSRADKGQAEQMRAFVEAATRGGPMPIPWAQLEATTRATFAIVESLRTGRPVDMAAA